MPYSRRAPWSWWHVTITALFTGLLTCGVARPQSQTKLEAALILRARAALGPGLGRVKSLHLSGTCTAGDINGTFETWVDLVGGRYESNINAGPLTAGYGYDGKTAWRSDSKGFVLPQTGPLTKAIVADEVFDNTHALFSANYGGASVSYLGPKTESDKSYEGIWIKPKDGHDEWIWLDSATALPARTIVNYGAQSTITNFSSYQSIAGLELPQEEITTQRIDVRDFYGHEAGFTSSERTCKYSTMEAYVPETDKHFQMPRSNGSDVLLPGGETRIPFTMQNYWILIDVRLNGQGPFRLMLDSGGRNILNPSLAHQIGAIEVGKVPQLSTSPLAKPTRYVRVANVSIGGATLTQQDFIAGHIGSVFTRDGMIGFELFERFLTTIDYTHRQIILRLPGHRTPEATPSQAEVSLPLEFDDTKPETACKVAGADATCIADTGAALALVLTGPFVKANANIQPPWYAGAHLGLMGSAGASEARYGPLSLLQIGPFSLANVDTMFITAANGALAQYPSALVGNRIWQKFTVTFDYSNAMLRLTPNAGVSSQ